MSGRGWIGSQRELCHYLRTVKADVDDDGCAILRAPESGGPSRFLGVDNENNDVVIAADVEYRCGDRWFNLAAGLGSTSYGVNVIVL